MPAEVANPIRLETWLLDWCKRKDTDQVSTRDIQQFGPGGLREKITHTKAIEVLAEHGRVRMMQVGRKKVVQINTALLGATP